MARISKEGYERKAAYAEARMRKNAEIESLTARQHELLADLCSLRHKLHSVDKNSMWNRECSDRKVIFNSFAYLFNEFRANGLPTEVFQKPWSWIEEGTLPSDADYWSGMEEDEQEEWETLAEEKGYFSGNIAWQEESGMFSRM